MCSHTCPFLLFLGFLRDAQRVKNVMPVCDAVFMRRRLMLHAHTQEPFLPWKTEGGHPHSMCTVSRASPASRDSTCGLSHTNTHTCTMTGVNNQKTLAQTCTAWWQVCGDRKKTYLLYVYSFFFLGGGHLHCEARRPVLYLSLLSTDPAQRLRPRISHLFQHRVHQMSQKDRLLHRWGVSLHFSFL